MKYKFYYIIDRKTNNEQSIEIEATTDEEAVLMLYDKMGIVEFGCIRIDGHFFSDRKYPILKDKILVGC
jgi:hypothetical protein